MSDNPQGLTAEEIDRLEKMLERYEGGGQFGPGTAFIRDFEDALTADAPALIAAAKRAASFQTQVAELSDKLNGTPCAEIRFSDALAAANTRIAELEENLRDLLLRAHDVRHFDCKQEFFRGDHSTYDQRKEAAIAELRKFGDLTEIIANEGDWCMHRALVTAVKEAAARLLPAPEQMERT